MGKTVGLGIIFGTLVAWTQMCLLSNSVELELLGKACFPFLKDLLL